MQGVLANAESRTVRSRSIALEKRRSPKVSFALLGLALALGQTPLAAAGDEGWTDLGFDLPGTHGSPVLEAEGLLIANSKLTLTLSNVRARARAVFVLGLRRIDHPFKGGTLVPNMDGAYFVNTGGTPGTPSTVTFTRNLPPGLPDEIDLFLQCWIFDDAGPEGFAASNAMCGTSRTLNDLISYEIDDRLEDAAKPQYSLAIYDVQDHTNGIYERNIHCWAYDVDLTGMSPWNEHDGPRRAGTLISPRHIAFAKHYPLTTDPARNKLRFITQDDVVIERAVVGISYPGDDIGIAVLDADVPPEITFYKVLPRNWDDHLGPVSGLAMLHLDQEEKALVRDMGSLSSNCNHRESTDPLRSPFTETLIGGDSGNPAFVLIDSEPVFLLTHFTAVHGPFYTAWFDEVNDAMTQLGGDYQLTEYDLDAYVGQ